MNKDKQSTYTSTNLMYFDVKIEAILPRASTKTFVL